MKDLLKHKNFTGSVHFNSEDEIFYGKIEGINDLVTYEGESVKGLTSSFKEAVEDYITICKANNKPVKNNVSDRF